MEPNYKICCEECGEEYKIEYEGKHDISYCPICGERIYIIEEAPLLSTFEDMDDYED